MAVYRFLPQRGSGIRDDVYFRLQKDGRLSVNFSREMGIELDSGEHIAPEYDPESDHWQFIIGDVGYKPQLIPGSQRLRISISGVPSRIAKDATETTWDASRKRDVITLTKRNNDGDHTRNRH